MAPVKAQSLLDAATQGEWGIGDENNHCCEVSLSNDACITMSREGMYTEEYVMGRAEMRGNLHLIAAAPFLAQAYIDQSEKLAIAVGALKKAEAEIQSLNEYAAGGNQYDRYYPMG